MLKLVLALTAFVSAAALAEPAHDFIRAAEMDDVSGVSKMLAAGMDPNTAEAQRGEPALVLAIREDAMRVVDVLLKDPRTRLEATASNGNTALMMAAFKGNRVAVEKLLAKGAVVNRSGWTALHYAAAGGHGEIVKLLLDKGAQIDAIATHGITPLILAAREGKHDAIIVLLERGADRTLRDSERLDAAQVAEKLGKPLVAETIRNFGTGR
jgi:ankyrin repeat protein